MIEIIKGNLFEHLHNATQSIYLLHVVNNAGEWGAGFVTQLDKYLGFIPKWSYQQFIGSFTNKSNALGHWSRCYINPNLTVIHLCAMNGTYNKYTNTCPLIYDALADCLQHFYGHIENEYCTVYMPRIGAGLARGKWDIIYHLIEKYHTVPTRIFEL